MTKLLAILILISVVIINGCKKDDYKATVGVCPVVVSSIPVNLAINVPLNQVISVTFNEKMNPATITAESFTITGTPTIGLVKAATVITGVITYSGMTATFTPSTPLSTHTSYTGKVATTVKDLMGNALQTPFEWTFNTDNAPTATPTDPANNATGVVLNKVITAAFNVPMDPATINATTVTLSQGTTPVAATVVYSGSSVSLTPASTLTANTLYTVTINTGAKNTLGTPLANNAVWSFTTLALPTVVSTDPANLAKDVVLNKVVTALFSEPMDPLTITGTTFTLKQGTTSIAGTVSYTGSTVSFKPTIALIPNTIYTGTITTGAKNVAGTALAVNHVWTFTTLTVVGPYVLSTDPIDLATNVELNKVVTATFSMPMDQLTITGTTFTLNQGTTSIAGAVTYLGSTASFTPTVALAPNMLYTGTITTGAKNVAGVSMAQDFVWSFTTGSSVVRAPLFTSVFGAFGGNAGVTNQGIHTVINNGSIGTTAASSLVTGLHDMTGDIYSETTLNIGNVKDGRIYSAPPQPVIPATGATGGTAETMAYAQAALLSAQNFYNSISPASKPGGTTLDNDELGGRTLAPGTYTSGSAYKITTIDLVLDGQGDANAVWIFQVPSDLTVGTPSGPRSITLINGAQARNIFWYVGGSAVINYAGGGTMEGTIIAYAGVTLSSPGNNTNAVLQTVLNGRAISLISSVTMVNTIINVPN